MTGGNVLVRSAAALILVCTALGAASAEAVVLGAEQRAELVALERIRGDALETSHLRDKVVVVTFFASWCPPCRAEFVHLNRMADEFDGADLTVVAINVFEEFDENDRVRLARFLEDTQPRFHVVKGDASVKRTFADVNRIPTVFVFDRTGHSVLHFIHARGASKMSVDEDELRIAISQALTR